MSSLEQKYRCPSDTYITTVPKKLFEGYSLKRRHLCRISQGCSIIGGCRRRICASESAADAKLQLPQANTAAQALAPPPSPLVQLNVQLDVPLQLRCSMNLQLYVQLNVQCANLKRQLVNPYGRGSAAHKWMAKIALPESLLGIVYYTDNQENKCWCWCCFLQVDVGNLLPEDQYNPNCRLEVAGGRKCLRSPCSSLKSFSYF